MKMEEFEKEVRKLIGKKKRGFKVVVSFSMNRSGKYVGEISVEGWKYGELFSYGHNFDFLRGVFLGIGYNNEMFENEDFEALVETVFNEIKYVIDVYDFLQYKQINKRFEFNC